MTDNAPRLFQIWLDASDGSIATYDGVQWPDGTADVHHRHRRPDGVQWTPESLAQTIHGKLARIEWTPDHAATLAAIREYLETSDDDGIHTREHLLGMLDRAGVPSTFEESEAEFDAAMAAGEPVELVDLPELTREDAVEAMEDMAGDLYRAEDRLAFVREMCDAADLSGEQVTTQQVRAWATYEGCGGAIVLPEETLAELVLRDPGYAVDLRKRGEERRSARADGVVPPSCGHEH